MKEIYDKDNTYGQKYKSKGKYYWRKFCLLKDGTVNIVGASHRGFDTKKERNYDYDFNVLSYWTEE